MNEFLKQSAAYFGISNEATATIFVSVLVFVAGLLINNMLHQMREYSKRKIVRRLAKINHRQMINQVRIEIMNLTHFGDELKIDHVGSFRYKSTVIPTFSTFLGIGYHELFKAYLTGIENSSFLSKKKKIKAFSSLWSSIIYFSTVHDDSKVRGQSHVETNSKLNEARNLSVGEAQKIIEEFRLRFHRQLHILEPLGAFYEKRERIIERFAGTPNRESPPISNAYLNEILELNRKNVDLLIKYESDIKSVELNKIILEGNYRYLNMKNHLDAASYFFSTLSDEYRKRNKYLMSSYRTLNYTFTGNFFRFLGYQIVRTWRNFFRVLKLR